MSGRDPHDGKPYYCKLCGAGFGEYIACELPDCELESIEEAERRIDKIAPTRIFPPRTLDKKGRCCGRKPLVYKRNHIYYCDRCNAYYDLTTKRQKSSWAWIEVEGGFKPKYLMGDHIEYAKRAVALASPSTPEERR